MICGVFVTSASAATPITSYFNACPFYSSQTGDPTDQPGSQDVRICSGEVPSHDGSKLDVDLTLPTTGGTSHPLMIMLHGFGNDKHEWESRTDEADGADKHQWNSRWFAKHGYYVLTYTARGFKSRSAEGHEPDTPPGSSGVDQPRARIHLKSRDTEIKDTQWLAALVAHSFPDLDREKVAVSGGSYGGGESWTQASQPTWSFPSETDLDLPVLKLQAAIPKYPWTDLAYSLAPNGHPGPWPFMSATQAETSPPGPGRPEPPKGYCDDEQSLSDDPCYSSSQGHPESGAEDEALAGRGNPFGVVKSSYSGVFYTTGQNQNEGVGFQVEDPCDRPQTAPVDVWFATAMGGEPYSSAPGVDNGNGAQIRRGLTECRASYYQDKQWKDQASKRKVAIFSIEGWTDDLFTAVESFRQFKYLKSLNPNWPVEVALADVGHPRAKNNPDTWRNLNNQAWNWLQSHIDPSGEEHETKVSSQQTVCEGRGREDPNDPNQNMTGRSPEALSAGKISATFDAGATSSASLDPNQAADDPIINEGLRQITQTTGNCPGSLGPAPYTRFTKPLKKDRTYVGLGSLTLPNYTLAPPVTAQVNVRVWDVPPGTKGEGSARCDDKDKPTPFGCPLLITRGTYRLDVNGGYDVPAPPNQIRVPFFGNHYKIRVGHKLRIDVTQQDGPYLRPSTVQSAFTFGAPTLNLPTRESGTTTVAAGP